MTRNTGDRVPRGGRREPSSFLPTDVWRFEEGPATGRRRGRPSGRSEAEGP
jgi:hypothetical protein